jgi:hypothetical protein
MPTNTLIRPDDLVAGWLSDAVDAHPAGPLYTTPYAEYDLIHEGRGEAALSCSGCTWSRPYSCC